MPFRPPKSFWEWLLLFAPGVAMYLSTLSIAGLSGFEWELYDTLLGGLVGFTIALVICVFAGCVFTKPTLAQHARIAWSLLAAVFVAAFNIGVILTVSVLVAR